MYVPKEREVPEQDSGTGSRVQSLGRYRIIAELARGGMGIVYLALVRGPGAFNKLLVLKELKPALLHDRHLVAMFLEEARLAACLSHPNIVQTIEAGSDDGRHYIAMEYLNGQSLHRLLHRAQKKGQSVPLAIHCSVLCAALEGLSYAHNAVDYDGQPLNIVHRDVSPHNLLVSYDGQTKVLDFGIAKAMNSGVETLAGVIKGKVAYMAPEQAACADVDARADVFSVGVILWEAVTSRRFWSALEGDGKILRNLLIGESPLARADAMDGVPLGLRPIIAKATAFNAEERYQSAGALLADLRTALHGLGLRSSSGPEISEYMQSLFAEDRARLQSAIEETLSFYRGPSSGQFPAVEVPSFSPDLAEVPSLNIATSERSPSGEGPVPLDSTIRSPAQVYYPTGKAEPEAPPRRSTLGRRLSWTLGAVALGAALMGAAISLRAPGRTSPALSASPSAVAATQPAAPGPDPGLPIETARVTVRASPASARITVDGQRMLDNPSIFKLARGGEAHSIRVEAEGFVPRDESFEVREDTTLVITLEPRKGVPRTPGLVRPASQTASVQPPAPPVTALAPRAEPPQPQPTTPGSVPLRRINPTNPYAQ